MIEVLQPPGLATPIAPYSTGLISDDLVLLSGQIPFNTAGQLVGPGFFEQAHQVFQNIGACLTAAGCSFRDVLKVTAYLASFENFEQYNALYAEYFERPYPARTTVQVGLYGFKIELDLLARRPPEGGTSSAHRD
jgi:2-iminobutanoate/2-iminopropanoate deaminase